MATFISNVFYFFLAFLILIFISVSSLQLYYDKAGPSNQDQLLIVNKGQSVASIASNLRDLNLIENRVVFMITLRLKGFHNKIKFGEYMIPRAASMKEIIEKLVSGVSAQYTITIPEGLSTISVIDLINKDMINYYLTPGTIYSLVKFSEQYNYNLLDFDLKDFLSVLIKENFYKKDLFIRLMIFELIELYLYKLSKSISKKFFNKYDYFIQRISNTKIYNLDLETLFMEFEEEILNG